MSSMPPADPDYTLTEEDLSLLDDAVDPEIKFADEWMWSDLLNWAAGTDEKARKARLLLKAALDMIRMMRG